MSAKLDRIGEERDKALRRREEWDARYKELDKRYREQENTEIHDPVSYTHLEFLAGGLLYDSECVGICHYPDCRHYPYDYCLLRTDPDDYRSQQSC